MANLLLAIVNFESYLCKHKRRGAIIKWLETLGYRPSGKIEDLSRGVISYEIYETSQARFINFILNDDEYKSLFIIWPFIMEFYRLQTLNIFSIRKRIVDTDGVNDVTYSRHSVITHVSYDFMT